MGTALPGMHFSIMFMKPCDQTFLKHSNRLIQILKGIFLIVCRLYCRSRFFLLAFFVEGKIQLDTNGAMVSSQSSRFDSQLDLCGFSIPPKPTAQLPAMTISYVKILPCLISNFHYLQLSRYSTIHLYWATDLIMKWTLDSTASNA